MKYKQKIRKVGNSSSVIVPSITKKTHNLKDGDYVLVTIQKIMEHKNKKRKI